MPTLEQKSRAEKIRAWFQSHPNADVREVAKKFGVPDNNLGVIYSARAQVRDAAVQNRSPSNEEGAEFAAPIKRRKRRKNRRNSREAHESIAIPIEVDLGATELTAEQKLALSERARKQLIKDLNKRLFLEIDQLF